MNKIIIAVLVSVLFFGCSKSNLFYNVQIRNNYFEQIQEIKLDTVKFGTLETNQISDIRIFAEGNFEFSAKTKSNLLISTSVNIVGHNIDILLYVDNTGKLRKEY